MPTTLTHKHFKCRKHLSFHVNLSPPKPAVYEGEETLTPRRYSSKYFYIARNCPLQRLDALQTRVQDRTQVLSKSSQDERMKTFFPILLLSCFQITAIVAACNLGYYRGSEFHPRGKTARVHTGFLPKMKTINSYARTCRVKIYITSSFRRTQTALSGAIVPPARKSNHYIGHAIDMNLIVAANNKWCNSKCLSPRNSKKWPISVKCFINKIRSDSVLRWGGDFRTPDTVHIDDKTNLRNRRLWNIIYKSIQKKCFSRG